MANPLQVNFCSNCGASVQERVVFGKKRPFCPRCGQIHFQDPKVAAAVLITREQEVLLIQRGVDPEKGKWSLPAGFVDAGEDPRLTAMRECEEETGLAVEITRLVDVLYSQEHPNGADILIVYAARIDRGILQARDDAVQARFFPLDELPPLAFETTRKILENLQ